jgi:predicted ribosome quality control (RQC) complex YloA/Tae2 family protein
VFFDALTTMAVRDALRAAWLGARVQRVGLLGARAIELELYAGGPRRWLVISAEGAQARVQLSAAAPAREERVTPLVLLLRKYVRDARLVAVEQPPWERVLLLSFRGWDDEQGERTVHLAAELVGRHANIILIGPDGAILDALRRVGPEQSRQRRILPHERYALPPPQAKPPPTALDAAALARAAAGADAQPLWQLLVGAATGISPLLAREVAFRATGDANTLAREVADWPRVADALSALIADAAAGRWAPCVARENGLVAAFAPYELTHHPVRERMATIWDALDAYYADELARAARPAGPALQGAAALREAIAERLERARRRTEALRRELTQVADADALRETGELLLAYASQIQPGQTTLEVGGRSIALDPQRSAVEQAQDLFRAYRKARSAQADLPERIAASEREEEYWAQLLAHSETARTPAELRALREELSWTDQPPPDDGRGRARPGAKRRGTGLGGRVRSAEGFEILVGRSARHNEEITFERAGPDDLWLHARGVPGAHVVVRSSGRDVPPDTLAQAAAYAAYYSAARTATAVEVDYTPRRYVKRIPGGPPGLVRYTHERTLRVAPRPLPGEP